MSIVLKWISRIAVGFTALIVTLFGLLTIGAVPAPTPSNSEVIRGRVTSLSAPHPEYGDMGIVVDGDYYYVNRASEVEHFEWEALLAEVSPGDEIKFTVVKPLVWHWFGREAVGPNSGPVAGVEAAGKLYMDPQVAAETWTAQARFQQNFWISLAILLALLTIGMVSPRNGRQMVEAPG